MKKILNKKSFLFILGFLGYFLLSFLYIWSIFKLIVCKKYYGTLSVPYLVMNIIFILIILFLIFYKINKRSLEKTYMFIVIPVGLAFMILQPMHHKPDEPHHIYRTYDIVVNHNLMPNKDEKNISRIEYPIEAAQLHGNAVNNLKLVDDNMNKYIDFDKTLNVASTAAGYSPLAYVFSSLGMFLGLLFHLSWYKVLLFSRLGNFIFTIIMGFLIIKKVPYAKLVFFVYLLNPMLLHQATAVSGDSVLNMLSLYYIVYLLYNKHNKNSLSYKDIALLMVFLLIISLIKLPYILLSLLLLIFYKKDLLKNDKRKIILTIFCLVIIVFILLLHRKMFTYINEPQYVNDSVDLKSQLLFILKNPLNYLLVLFNDILNKSEFYLTSFAGKYLAWVDLENHSLATIVYLIILSISPFIYVTEDDEKNNTFFLKKTIFIGSFIVLYLCLLTGMYLEWTSVKSTSIAGFQGRYLIPILILIPLAFHNNRKNLKYSYKVPYTICLLIVNFLMLYNLVIAYI